MTSTAAPNWFKWVSIGALVWNVIGVMAFIATMMITPEMLAELPPAEQDLYNNTPAWANAAFGIAVLAGAAGCIALLLKKAFALPLFIASLAGVTVQMFQAYGLADAFSVTGVAGLVMPILIAFIAIDLIVLSFKAKSNGWIV